MYAVFTKEPDNSMRTKIGFVYDPVYLTHNTGFHVENSQRLSSIIDHLKETGLMDRLVTIKPRPATAEELAEVHAPEYIESIRRSSETGVTFRVDPDTVVSPGSWNAALYAAGGVIAAVESVIRGKTDYAFAAVRPPGHHATCWHAMGFCLFNNIAVAAKYARKHLNVGRILIVDFDVHHGNGTQDAFYADPHVFYFSTHQHPLFPGTGSMHELGVKKGEGYTANVPMMPGCGDDEYQAVFEDVLAPLARRFKPDLILVSAGYDAHRADPIAQMNLSVSGFARLTEIVKVLANMLCGNRLVFCLEGGYNLEALSLSVAATLNVLYGKKQIDDPLGHIETPAGPSNFFSHLKSVKDIHHIS